MVRKRDPHGPGVQERRDSLPSAVGSLLRLDGSPPSSRLRASDIMEPNLTYVYPHTRIQSLVSILRTTVHHAFPVVTENRGNEKEFMKGNQLISNNIKFKVQQPEGSGGRQPGSFLTHTLISCLPARRWGALVGSWRGESANQPLHCVQQESECRHDSKCGLH